MITEHIKSKPQGRGGLENSGIKFGPALGLLLMCSVIIKLLCEAAIASDTNRVAGNTLIFPATGNPPTNVVPTFNFGNFDTVGQSTGQIALAPFSVHGANPNATVPSVQSFSFQIQHEVGFGNRSERRIRGYLREPPRAEPQPELYPVRSNVLEGESGPVEISGRGSAE